MPPRLRLAVMILALAAPASAQTLEPETIWYSITAGDGAAVGHASQQVVETAEGRQVVNMQELLLREPGHPANRVIDQTVATLDRQGRAVALSDYSQSGRSWTRTVAKIAPGRAEITRSTRTEKRTLSVALPPGVRFDAGSGLLRDWNPAADPRIEFRNFSIDAMAVERMTLELAPGTAARPGEGLMVLRKRFDGADLRAIARLELGPDRRIISVTQPMFGASITTRPTDRATALKPHEPYPVLANALIKSPFRISDTAALGQIRYRFGFKDGIAFAPPQTAEQRVAASADGLVIDICEDCGPGLGGDPATLAEALRPTAWLQSDHPRLLAMARPTARLKVPDARKMELLAVQARAAIRTIEFTGHHSALQTLERQAGDCTEAAVLLAALGRAAGIPTRVVNGLVYSRPSYHGVSNVFMPHSWVVAWVDGRWRSYDAGLERFDATHIVLTIGDGDARSIAAASQLASLLRWDAMAEVRPRPANGS